MFGLYTYFIILCTLGHIRIFWVYWSFKGVNLEQACLRAAFWTHSEASTQIVVFSWGSKQVFTTLLLRKNTPRVPNNGKTHFLKHDQCLC